MRLSSALKPHIRAQAQAATGKSPSPFPPTRHRDRCIACTSAHLKGNQLVPLVFGKTSALVGLLNYADANEIATSGSVHGATLQTATRLRASSCCSTAAWHKLDMKELFRKRVGNYYLGRTLGEVRQPGHTAHWPHRQCADPARHAAGHLCEGQVRAACGDGRGGGHQGMPQPAVHSSLCACMLACMQRALAAERMHRPRC